MEIDKKIIKKFGFDLEMGTFTERYDYSSVPPMYLFKGNEKELEFIASILSILEYRDISFREGFKSNGIKIQPSDKVFWFTSYSTLSDNSRHNEIPDYIKEYLG